MIKAGGFNSNNSSIEIISEGTLGRPAVVRIGQEEYSALEQDPNTILILEKVARDVLLKDLPLGIALTPCKGIQPLSEAIHSKIEESVRPKVEGDWSETAFIRAKLIPLLKSLGFRNVVFNHGPREFGRDILFSRQSEFGIPEYWAAQVKLGNVSGKSNSYIDLIVSQAQEAFKIPVLDIQTKSKIWISKFVVMITGRFTENAVEKICEKIESHSLRNNLIFVDGEKLQELIHSSGLARQPRRRRLGTLGNGLPTGMRG